MFISAKDHYFFINYKQVGFFMLTVYRTVYICMLYICDTCIWNSLLVLTCTLCSLSDIQNNSCAALIMPSMDWWAII